MEIEVSAQESARSPSISESNPAEKEISDDDDDDRNHKHRRRDDARSQSPERDAAEQVYTKPYRRGNKPFENGRNYRETGSQSSETWKNHSFNPMDSKFDRRRPGFTQSSQGPFDMNQRNRGHQGPFRGRGRDSGPWNQRDSRFSSADVASQIVQQGPVPPGMFAGRGLPTASNAYGPSWGPFGLVPGMPNGGMDTLHPLGLQGTYRSINPSMNLGLTRQRCRDFEEQGFCLRGDMCPMEHGVNRIVVEDVQSLSQFNLPVSLQTGPGPLPASGAPTNSFKSSHGKTSKRGVGGNGQGLNDTFIDSAAGVGSDFYDPDQPLWGNDPQTSPALQTVNQSNVKENGSLMDSGPSGDQVGMLDGCDEHLVKSGGTGLSLGRINSSKHRTEMRETMVSKASSSIDKQALSNRAQFVPHHDKHNNALKIQSGNGNGKSVSKPSQKAQCTIFVSGVPLHQNRREALISHFHKFGEIISINIPAKSERAFVQFSKREEAEAALMAPDAVMGNRFIKLWWASYDNTPINGTTSGSTAPQIPPRGSSALPNSTIAPVPAAVPTSDHPKLVIVNTPKAPPPSQKKMENLEVLKEELRKKQEMLDQKRNEFKRKLEKLAKQTTALKGEVEPDWVAKRPKLGTSADTTTAATSSSSDPETNLSSPRVDEVMGNDNKSLESDVPQSSKSTTKVVQQEPPLVKLPPLRSLPPVGQSVATNRFKLDNRPTAFKIISILPTDLANVAVLKEHFSPFGDLSEVELDDQEPTDINNDPGTAKYSARVYFKTRHSAEKAFSSGKCWNGHNFQFSWLKSSNRESPLPTPKGKPDVSASPVVEDPKVDSQKPATSGDVESEKIEQKDIENEETEPDESHQAS